MNCCHGLFPLIDCLVCLFAFMLPCLSYMDPFAYVRDSSVPTSSTHPAVRPSTAIFLHSMCYGATDLFRPNLIDHLTALILLCFCFRVLSLNYANLLDTGGRGI